MSEYVLKIKMPSTGVPAKGRVTELIDNKESFSSVIAKTPKGRWGVYIDSSDPENLWGNIDLVDDLNGRKPEGETVLLEITARKYKLTVDYRNGNAVTAKVETSEEEVQTEDGMVKASELVQSLADEKVAAGIIPREEMDAIIAYLYENHVDEHLIVRNLQKFRKYEGKQPKRPSTIYVDPFLEAEVTLRKETIISRGLRHALSGYAIMCEGEKSVGKNVYIDTIAWVMWRPERLITFTNQMSPSFIYGEKTTDNSSAQALRKLDPEILSLAEQADSAQKCLIQTALRENKGKSFIDKMLTNLPEEWKSALKQKAEFEKNKAQAASVNIVIDQSELYDWLVYGGILVFNEMNMADPNFLASFLNQLTDGTGYIFIPGRGEVYKDPDCVLFATQNAGYEGTEEQNEASMSRMNCISFQQPERIIGQLKAGVHAKLKEDGMDVDVEEELFIQSEKMYMACREAVLAPAPLIGNSSLNIRGFVRAISMVAESYGYCRLQDAIADCVINTCSIDERRALTSLMMSCVTL